MFCWHRWFITPTWHQGNCVKVSDVAWANVEVKILRGKCGIPNFWNPTYSQLFHFHSVALSPSQSITLPLSPSVSHSLILSHCLRSLCTRLPLGSSPCSRLPWLFFFCFPSKVVKCESFMRFSWKMNYFSAFKC